MAKKDAAVAAAEAALAAKQGELTAALEAVERLRGEVGEASRALREARLAADEALPQCVLVKRSLYSSRDEERGRVVVLRKTPGGQLVVRLAGEDGGEMRFKRSKYSGEWLEAVKSSGWSSDTWLLSDVPPEYEAAASA